LNDSLQNSLTPFNVRQLNKVLPTFVIPSIDDTHTLSELAQSSKGYQTVLMTSASLNRLNIEAAKAAEKINSPTISQVLDIPSGSLNVFGEKDYRSTADYSVSSDQDIPVMIE